MNATTKVKLESIIPNLTCHLCKGYLIDATTIIECLHSFCKTCIVQYLEKYEFCPVCDVQLHSSKPLSSVRSDQVLQEVVYKLVPGLYQDEMERRRKWYKQHPESTPTNDLDSGQACNESYITSDDIIQLTLEPADTPVRDQTRRFYRCPAGVSVALLKDFLRKKYDLPIAAAIEILHGERVQAEDYLLMDIAYKTLWTRKNPLQLFYRFRGERTIFLNQIQPLQRSTKAKRKTPIKFKALEVNEQSSPKKTKKPLLVKATATSPLFKPVPLAIPPIAPVASSVYAPLTNGVQLNGNHEVPRPQGSATTVVGLGLKPVVTQGCVPITCPNQSINNDDGLTKVQSEPQPPKPTRGRRKKTKLDQESEIKKLKLIAANGVELREQKEVQLRISETGTISARNVISGEERIIVNTNATSMNGNGMGIAANNLLKHSCPPSFVSTNPLNGVKPHMSSQSIIPTSLLGTTKILTKVTTKPNACTPTTKSGNASNSVFLAKKSSGATGSSCKPKQLPQCKEKRMDYHPNKLLKPSMDNLNVVDIKLQEKFENESNLLRTKLYESVRTNLSDSTLKNNSSLFRAEITPITEAPPPKPSGVFTKSQHSASEEYVFPGATGPTDFGSKLASKNNNSSASSTYAKRLQTTIVNGNDFDLKFTKNQQFSPNKSTSKAGSTGKQESPKSSHSTAGSPTRPPKFFKSRHVMESPSNPESSNNNHVNNNKCSNNNSQSEDSSKSSENNIKVNSQPQQQQHQTSKVPLTSSLTNLMSTTTSSAMYFPTVNMPGVSIAGLSSYMLANGTSLGLPCLANSPYYAAALAQFGGNFQGNMMGGTTGNAYAVAGGSNNNGTSPSSNGHINNHTDGGNCFRGNDSSSNGPSTSSGANGTVKKGMPTAKANGKPSKTQQPFCGPYQQQNNDNTIHSDKSVTGAILNGANALCAKIQNLGTKVSNGLSLNGSNSSKRKSQSPAKITRHPLPPSVMKTQLGLVSITPSLPITATSLTTAKSESVEQENSTEPPCSTAATSVSSSMCSIAPESAVTATHGDCGSDSNDKTHKLKSIPREIVAPHPSTSDETSVPEPPATATTACSAKEPVEVPPPPTTSPTEDDRKQEEPCKPKSISPEKESHSKKEDQTAVNVDASFSLSPTIPEISAVSHPPTVTSHPNDNNNDEYTNNINLTPKDCVLPPVNNNNNSDSDPTEKNNTSSSA